MCGIAGLWSPNGDASENARITGAMLRAIHHRGPDGDGVWSDAPRGLVLGHKRLSILDLSEHGAQPMVSESSRYVLTYNGEIYNTEELRDELGRNASSFRGHSDTEVALAVIEKVGLEAAVRRFNGMFALALWDRDEQQLSLVRDRLGIKPLYYGVAGRSLVFGSDSGALRAHPAFDRALNPEAVSAFLRASCIPAPLCIHRDASKLMPGTIVSFSSWDAAPIVTRYWDPTEVAERGQGAALRQVDSGVLIDELDALLTDSVKRRMVSDVPLGAFLSGGIDSSTDVGLMSKLSSRPVKTFTIGTAAESHDESGDARAIAAHYGTDHHELIVTPEDAHATAHDLASFYDEPFADSSQLPTLLVARLAREHVTVSLSGDGGDELFAGYNRHVWGPRVDRIRARIPALLRSAFAKRLANLRPETLEWIYANLVPAKGSLNMRFPADKAVKFAKAVSSKSQREMYERLANATVEPSSVLNSEFFRTAPKREFRELGDVAHSFMLQDMTGYLPNDILTKVDRASMAVSLEARVPLLDHRVVEFAWQLPRSVKLADGQGKWILREVLAKYLPKEAVDRPKSGFGIPLAAWLRGPLRDWAGDMLSQTSLRKTGIFDVSAVRTAWTEHERGQRDNGQHLWDLLMLQTWLDRCFSGPSGAN